MSPVPFWLGLLASCIGGIAMERGAFSLMFIMLACAIVCLLIGMGQSVANSHTTTRNGPKGPDSQKGKSHDD